MGSTMDKGQSHEAQAGAVRQEDVIDPARANALMATLGRAERVQAGHVLPHFFHQIYFWNAKPPAGLGRDGHPKVGGIIPDMGLPRRMWAGGALTFHTGLRAGEAATRVTTCTASERKEGRSGPLGFVTLRHEIWQGDTLCMVEDQNLVYRAEHDPDAPALIPPIAKEVAEEVREVSFDSTLLFRYSALTFNGHRIHYDQSYAREVEGYDDLVVHGPLLAQLLMLWAEETIAPLTTFRFRGTSALTLGKPARLLRAGGTLWVESAGRVKHMVAEAQ